jgi:PAS domain S-box-containing protein
VEDFPPDGLDTSRPDADTPDMSHVHVVRDGQADEGGLNRRLRDAERTLAETQRLARIGSWSWDIASGALSWSDEMYRLYGLSPHEFDVTFDAAVARTHPDDLHVVEQGVGAVVDGSGEGFEFDYRIVRPNGDVLWLRARGRGVRDDQGNAVWMFGTVQDITESREAEEQLRAQRDELAVLAGVMQATDDAVIVTSPDGTVLRWNSGAERLYGYTAAEAVGQHVSFMLPDRIKAQLPNMFAEVSRRRHLRFDSAGVRKDGTELLTSVTLSQVGPTGGPATARVAIVRDVTEQKRAEEREREHARQLAQLAFHDPLTGLANRALLHDRLTHSLARREQHRADVLLLDLDDFKTVNDVSGHAAGDQLLVEAARRLLACVRPEDTVARLGRVSLFAKPDCDGA